MSAGELTEREPPGRPSRGVRPIEVFCDLPSMTRQTEPPPPMCAITALTSVGSLPRCLASCCVMLEYERPWNPYLLSGIGVLCSGLAIAYEWRNAGMDWWKSVSNARTERA